MELRKVARVPEDAPSLTRVHTESVISVMYSMAAHQMAIRHFFASGRSRSPAADENHAAHDDQSEWQHRNTHKMRNNFKSRR